jgi:N-methylhydantoinase B/oxoprolinase/acetone carboxylase alpha subunit
VPLRRGDLVRFDSQGGGSYGPAGDRAPAAIARDVADGKLSRDAARRVYGGVFGEHRTRSARTWHAARTRASPSCSWEGPPPEELPEP